MTMDRPIRVLVVDDSAIVRRILTDTLDAEPDIKVVGTAPDPYVARDKILKLEPDVLTLDIEMPRMDGLTFLQKLMHHRPMPVIVISSIGSSSCEMAMEAMRRGAVEVLAKPSGPYSVGGLRTALAMKIRAAARARVQDRAAARTAAPAPVNSEHPVAEGSIIAIGASTGGTEALERLLRSLPSEVPGIVIVQHIPPGFSRAFANRLHQVCQMDVREAAHGDYVVPGRVLIAPGDYHVLVRRAKNTYRVSVKSGPRVCYQRPSVDVLFESVAETAGARAVGVILTGMGSDGAEGMLKMKQAGGYNLAQNKETCVVYGMPGKAVQRGAVDQSLPLDKIASEMLRQAAHGPSAKRQAS
jgi:two-component system, chemotaxis family, protein-glutamate methylesterase/glutaminase